MTLEISLPVFNKMEQLLPQDLVISILCSLTPNECIISQEDSQEYS